MPLQVGGKEGLGSLKPFASVEEPSVLEVHNALACDLEAGLSLRCISRGGGGGAVGERTGISRSMDPN